MGYIVIHVKIIDDKRNGLVMHGPIANEFRSSMQEAEIDARGLIETTKNCTVIPRIYEVATIPNIEKAMSDAQQFFKNLYNNMLEAKAVLSKPIYKRKKNTPKYET